LQIIAAARPTLNFKRLRKRTLRSLWIVFDL
jgi:hypothetical protein